MRTDPKPLRRVRVASGSREALEVYAKVHHRGSRCRLCSSPRVTAHHLVPRSRGGDDVRDNLIPLCHSCHEEFEHGRQRPLFAAQIRAALEPGEVAYIIKRAGEGFLERYYPRSA